MELNSKDRQVSMKIKTSNHLTKKILFKEVFVKRELETRTKIKGNC